MEWYSYALFFLGTPIGLGLFSLILAVLILWSLIWKALALWHAAQRRDLWWFVAILILNSAGILEIVYLLFVAKIPLGELLARRS